MKITLIQIGKTEDEQLRNLINIYNKRIEHFISYNVITIPELQKTSKLSPAQVKDKEAELINKQIKNNEYLVLLDERGKELGSKEFAEFLQQKMNQSLKEVVFIVGGSFGVADSIKEKANYKLSLSKMTFSHQLIRLIFSEQLYRAMTILKNVPYHNE